MENLQTTESTFEVPPFWDHCEIHNLGEHPFQIYYLFVEEQTTILLEIKKDSGGNEYASIKPLTDRPSSYRKIFAQIMETHPTAEIIFF